MCMVKTRPQEVDSGLFLKIQLLYLKSVFLSVAYVKKVNLARLGISVHYKVSVRCQYLVRLLSLCWITGIEPRRSETWPPK